MKISKSFGFFTKIFWILLLYTFLSKIVNKSRLWIKLLLKNIKFFWSLKENYWSCNPAFTLNYFVNLSVTISVSISFHGLIPFKVQEILWKYHQSPTWYHILIQLCIQLLFQIEAFYEYLSIHIHSKFYYTSCLHFHFLLVLGLLVHPRSNHYFCEHAFKELLLQL